jgi:hypothetical protein
VTRIQTKKEELPQALVLKFVISDCGTICAPWQNPSCKTKVLNNLFSKAPMSL